MTQGVTQKRGKGTHHNLAVECGNNDNLELRNFKEKGEGVAAIGGKRIAERKKNPKEKNMRQKKKKKL